MSVLFLKILNLSVVSSFLIVAVIILRLALKHSPKWIRYVLWAMVGLRLVVPFSFESRLSILPNAQDIDSSVSTSTSYVTTTQVNSATTSVSPLDVMSILSFVWLSGVILILLYMAVSFVRVHLLVRESIKLRDNIYICDRVGSPFVLGVIKPKIYLNSSLTKRDMRYIIAHEETHIRHHDNIFKPLSFVILSLHWFNPLVWVSYFLFVKDIELFCDESVVKSFGKKGKKKYSTVLLNCSMSKNTITTCPLAFAENNVKTRVKNVLSYKKPALYIVVISVVLCVITMMLFMTSPVSAKETQKADVKPTETVTESASEAPTEKPTEPPTNPPTEKPTEKPTEAPTDPPVQEYYEESYYDNNYYGDSYSDDLHFVPFSEVYDPYEYTNIYDTSNNSSGSNYHYPFGEKTDPLPDTIYIFEEPRNNVGSAFSNPQGVQRADSWLTGIK
ncbi:MAG: hypothetical protein IJ015_01200 [Ruminococcus sp.]|nr:hypothetical protein [Ruminococcus sp.]